MGFRIVLKEEEGYKMKIVILEGSPNRHGSSNLLAEEFKRGAEAAGHRVVVIDAAHADIHPCTGSLCPEGRDGGDPGEDSGGGHDGVRHAALLLRDVGPAENL